MTRDAAVLPVADRSATAALPGVAATVVKLGGSLFDDVSRREPVLDRLAEIACSGERLVIVHGGGKALSRTLERLGMPSRFVAGLRVTDEATLRVAAGVLAGAVGKSLALSLGARGVRAVSLAGSDAGILRVVPHPPVADAEGAPVELGRVGTVAGCDPAAVRALLAARFLPLLATIARGEDGTLYNVNADPAASALAIALGARRLVFLTDVAGVLDSAGETVREMPAGQIDALMTAGAVTGGMLPKLRSCALALRSGVRQVLVASGDSFARAGLDGATGTLLHA